MTDATDTTDTAIAHHTAEVNGTTLHYASLGSSGSPILLVHGFPESWWAFRKVMPALAAAHRVVAVDLRGFGDSANPEGDDASATAAADLHALIAHLGMGPVHLLVQDLSGGVGYRLAAAHPDDVRSLIAVETGLAGFGAEALADVTKGGAWYIGALTAPGIADLLFAGREAAFLSDLYASYGAVPAVTEADLAEYARTYSRPDGFRGAIGLYRSMLGEGEELRGLAEDSRLSMPVLTIGSGGGAFTESTLRQVADGELAAVEFDDVGHYVAQEAPERLASAVLEHVDRVDGDAAPASR